jgi:hypothetical protein
VTGSQSCREIRAIHNKVTSWWQSAFRLLFYLIPDSLGGRNYYTDALDEKAKIHRSHFLRVKYLVQQGLKGKSF